MPSEGVRVSGADQAAAEVGGAAPAGETPTQTSVAVRGGGDASAASRLATVGAFEGQAGSPHDGPWGAAVADRSPAGGAPWG